MHPNIFALICKCSSYCIRTKDLGQFSHAFITWWLDECDWLCLDLLSLHRMQLVQNAALHPMTATKTVWTSQPSVSPNWLPLYIWMEFKMSIFVLKILHGLVFLYHCCICLLGGSSSVEMGWEWVQVPVAKQEIGKWAGSRRGAECKTVISISGINNTNIIDGSWICKPSEGSRLICDSCCCSIDVETLNMFNLFSIPIYFVQLSGWAGLVLHFGISFTLTCFIAFWTCTEGTIFVSTCYGY